jgi:uncharacterized protein
MRWQTGRRSGNIEDRRGKGGMMVGGGIGAVVITLIAMFLGVNPDELPVGGVGPAAEVENARPGEFTGTDEEADMVSSVLGSTEDVWTALFQQSGSQYVAPELVLFDNVVQSACGMAQSAVGPFYCPLDQQVYLDMSFFRELSQRFGAPGDFARAYVIAHEVGHHVQKLTGVADRIRSAQEGASQTEANALQVRMELQADCFAGVWGHHADRMNEYLESGDVEEALAAASAIGDDRLQRESQGQVVPESFTHGTSAQRVNAFRTGMQSGDPQKCTF